MSLVKEIAYFDAAAEFEKTKRRFVRLFKTIKCLQVDEVRLNIWDIDCFGGVWE